MEDEMRKKILDILKEIRPDADYAGSTDFIEDEMLDSFDMIQLVSRIEEEFACEIDGLDISIENFANIDAICKVIEKNGGSL